MRDSSAAPSACAWLSVPFQASTPTRPSSCRAAQTSTPPAWYEGAYKLKVASEIANTAAGIGFDASDLMPAAVGAGTFWTKAVEWVNNGGADTDAILKAIDDSWPAQP